MLEIHALLEGKKKIIEPSPDIRKYFNYWKSLAEQYGETDFDFVSFFAGWTMNNPILRERILKAIYHKEKAEGKFDDPTIK